MIIIKQKKKIKTYLGLASRAPAITLPISPVHVMGPFSSFWAFVGRRWLLRAFLGLRWPSLAVVNCCGPLWACVGLCWPSLAAVGLPGLSSNRKIKNKMYIKKKTPPMRRSGPFSSLWAFVGRRWLLWAFLGLRWPSLAAVGLPGPALAFVGRCWLLWAFLGLVVIKRVKMKCTLRKTPTYGPNDASRVVWALFHLRGPSLAVVGCCGPSWACVGLLWLLCDSLSRFTMLIAVVG